MDVIQVIKPSVWRNIWRVVQYMLSRLLVLVLMLAAGLFLAVIVANMGGYIDQIYRANIDEAIQFTIPPAGMSPEQTLQFTNELRAKMESAYGLDQPFLLRCARWTWNAATMQWGTTRRFKTLLTQDEFSNDVAHIVAERFTNTLLLFTSANLLLFIVSLAVAFGLYRRYGSLLDRVMTSLAVLSSIPNWIFGALLYIIFAVWLNILPFGGMLDSKPISGWLQFALTVARHMLLPGGAIFLGMFFQSVAAWRALFLLQESEDYIELARAKGLPESAINRRYLVRPTLPYIVTSFAMLMLGAWQNSMALELWFAWPGIGQLLFLSFGGGSLDRNIMLAVIVTFAYLLAITVFSLDLLYVVLDPRIKLGGGETLQTVTWRERLAFFFKKRWRPAPPQRLPVPRQRISLAIRWRHKLDSLRPVLRELWRTPAVIVGLGMILALMAVSAYTVRALPYAQTVHRWSSDQQSWYQNPRNARPLWYNLFRRDRLPENIRQDTREELIPTQTEPIPGVGERITYSFFIDYPYRELPQELSLYFKSSYLEKKPYLLLSWHTPDGRELPLANFSIIREYAYNLTSDTKLQRRFGNPDEILRALFSNPQGQIQPGRYELRVVVNTFEPGVNVATELILYGQAHGWAGTDNRRRDLGLALLWGTPIALSFGVLGALFTSLLTFGLAGLAAWFGGWLDDLIQRLSEISMLLPTIPLAMMVYYLYSKTLWAILGTIILLSIFGGALKNYRAAFLQAKNAPYVEAARAYGASDWHIIWNYLLPRILPVLIPQIIVLIPGFVFLEATLAFLGVSDIFLPTWGKLLYDAIQAVSLAENLYWVIEPIALLLLTGLSFALLGMSLDRILNPKLRQR